MSNQDREAFEADCQRREVYTGRHVEFPEQYQLFETQLRWMGWQAARDHYAPKLTERDALEVAAKHIAIADCGKWETLPEGDERDVHRGRTCRLYYRYLAKSAFSAAGVRWKEEA